MKQIQTALFVADIHYPSHDKRVLDIARQIAKDLNPDYLCLLGDCFNADGISKFTIKNWKVGAYETVAEIKRFKKNYYEPLVKTCKKSKIKYCLGNHENRTRDFLSKVKQKEGLHAYKDWSEKFNLKSYFKKADIKEYNKCHKIGRLYFTHGEYHND